MKLTHLLAGTALSALVAAAPAQAGTVNGVNFFNGLSTQTIDGIAWTAAPTGATFQKSSFGASSPGAPAGGWTGVGINSFNLLGGPDLAAPLINIGEFLNGGFNSSVRIVNSFVIGLLFDGPEFGDVQEVMQVTFSLLGGGSVAYTLTNNFNDPAVWTGPGTLTQISDDLSNNPAVSASVFSVTGMDLADVTGVSFTALPGTCGTPSPCTNQTDYALVQFVTTVVPEPATLGLLTAGLLGLGFAARRRKAA